MINFSFVKRIPFLGICTAYLVGILVHEFNSFNLKAGFIFFVLLLILLSVLCTDNKSSLILILIYSLCLLSGYTNAALRESRLEELSAFFLDRQVSIRATILSVDSLNNYDKCTLEIDGHHLLKKIKALAYFEKTNREMNLQPGHMVNFTAKAVPIKSFVNPDAFNYSKYLYNKGIIFQFFVDAGEWQPDLLQDTKNLLYIRFKWIERLKVALSKNLKKDQVALIQAITLGQKEELSQSTLNAFSNTGARHILAVSGMHVGIMMLLIQFLLRLIPGRKVWLQRFRFVITLCGIWMYAWITGMAPPVTRASFMFTLFLIGGLGKKDYHSLNALFLSAFVLLLINPALIFDLGFQFSYTALLSIILFYPLFYKRIKSSNKVVNYLIQIILLTLAVQPFILPLSIFYFHKIPLLFLLSSLLATPLAFVLMLLTLLFFIDFFIFHFFYPYIAWFLGEIADLFNTSIYYLDGLSFSTVENVWISPFSLSILIAGACLLYYFLKKARKSLLYGLLLLLNTFLFSTMQSQEGEASELCIYADPKMALVDVFIDRHCFTWNNLQVNSCAPGFSNREHRIRKRVKETWPILTLDTEFFIVEMGNLSLGVYLSSRPKIHECRTIDVLLIHTNDIQSIEALLQDVDVSCLVLTSGVKHNVRKWLRENYDDRIWDLKKRGAFVHKIEDK
jgi:competence protein ComEC